ncbi:MAG: class I SAM-dependent methyltransferase [Chloroflexota bacterium]
MNWHLRYTQQAKWTRDLRAYLFEKADLPNAQRVLEAGCGTGAILSKIPIHIPHHGLDLNPAALAECRVHAPAASLVRGNALALPYSDQSFDIVYCHFLLLWVKDPIQALREMKRVTKTGGYIIAFAEPDYSHRIDQPDELIQLGKWQTESLIKQGANPALGAELAELFFQASIPILETGTIQSVENEPSLEEWELEWAVIESDLADSASGEEVQRMKKLDQQARARGERILNVPTYFVWGQI